MLIYLICQTKVLLGYSLQTFICLQPMMTWKTEVQLISLLQVPSGQNSSMILQYNPCSNNALDMKAL